MDINDLTIGQAKELAAMFGAGRANAEPADAGLNGMVGKTCIVRTYSAGVWFGEIEQKSRNEVIVKNARRMWLWHAAKSISLSGVAVHGIDAKKSRIAPAVEQVWLEAIELIPVSGKAAATIENAPDAQAE
jgi:hypothetical protein